MATSSQSSARNAFVIKEPGAAWAGKAGVQEGPAATYEAEQAALRAYPADSIPASALQNSLNTYAQLRKAHGHKSGHWMQLGPTRQAKYPAFLDQFLGG